MTTWLICLVTLLLSSTLSLARPERSLERRTGGLSGAQAAAMECVEKAVAALLPNPAKLTANTGVLGFIVQDCARAHGVKPEISPRAWADLQKLSNQVGRMHESDDKGWYPSDSEDRVAYRRQVHDRNMQKLFGTMPTRDPVTSQIIDGQYVSPVDQERSRFPLAQKQPDKKWIHSEGAAAQCLEMEVERLVRDYDWPRFGRGMTSLREVINECEGRHGHRPQLTDALRARLQVGSNKHARYEEQRREGEGDEIPKTPEEIRESVDEGAEERYGVPPQRDPQTGRVIVIDGAQPSQMRSGGIGGRRVASMPSKMSLSNINMRTMGRQMAARLTDTVKTGGSALKSSMGKGTTVGKPNDWWSGIAASVGAVKPYKPAPVPLL
ncbi:MAG: Vacuolar protein sorting-associated protein 4 [Watsoniomyces obsoletus]|nr:MAG: Vacuolar protein sorting-associated protein 4 [Watsoniomyces obsoletus]